MYEPIVTRIVGGAPDLALHLLGGSCTATLTGPIHFTVISGAVHAEGVLVAALRADPGLVLATTSYGRKRASVLFSVGTLNKVPRESFLDVHLQCLESFSTLNSWFDLHGSGSCHNTCWGSSWPTLL